MHKEPAQKSGPAHSFKLFLEISADIFSRLEVGF